MLSFEESMGRGISSALPENHAADTDFDQASPVEHICNDKLPLREGFIRESRHSRVSMCIGALPGMSI
jgi:hypothetical protein